MSTMFCRVALATGLLILGHCAAAPAQISLGIGSAAHREAEAHILQQLETRDSFVFEDVPLTQFVQLLRDRFEINVVIDRNALDDLGIDTATPVSVHLKDATLESSLNLVLDSLELSWMIRYEAIVITTPEQAESRLETRVYPVRDLVLIQYDRSSEPDFDGLIDTITSTIEPDSWDEVGGPGAIDPEAASLTLVISQTWRVHRDLEQLVTTLRAARDKQGVSPIRIGSPAAKTATYQPSSAPRYGLPASSVWQVPRMYDD